MNTTSTNAEPLVRAAQSGDASAFESLVDEHYDRIFHYALKYCGSKPDAEDITQQVCVKLARTLHQFRFEAAFTTWLYRLVINCANDWYRTRPSTQEVDDALQPTEPVADHEVMLRQTLEIIDAMGIGFRDAVTLVLGEGLTHREAADVLQVAESTVSWRIHEARKRLLALEANYE